MFPTKFEQIELSRYLENIYERRIYAFLINVELVGSPSGIFSEEFLRLFSKEKLSQIYNEDFDSIKFGIIQDDKAVAWTYNQNDCFDIVSNLPSYAWEIFNRYFSSNQQRFELRGSGLKISNKWTDDIFTVQALQNVVINHMEKQQGNQKYCVTTTLAGDDNYLVR